MRKRTAVFLPVVAGLTLPPAAGQALTVGSPVPDLTVTRWLHRERLDLDAVLGKRVVVLSFWRATSQPSIRSLDMLVRIGREFAGRGVRIITVAVPGKGGIDPIEKALAKLESPLPVAVDEDGRCFTTFVLASGDKRIPKSFVIDKKGRIAWIGHPKDLERGIRAALRGETDAAYAKRLRELQAELGQATAAGDHEAIVALADRLLEIDRTRREAWTWKVHAYRQVKRDEKLAREVIAEAVTELAERPTELARFIEQNVLASSSGSDDEVLKRALLSLRRATRGGVGGIEAQLALFKLAGRCGRTRVAQRAAHWIAENLDATGSHLAQLSQALVASKEPSTHALLAAKLIERLRERPRDSTNLTLEFDLLHACCGKLDEARKRGREIIDLLDGNDTAMNNFAWYLMTFEHRKGKFSQLALEAAERMGKKSGRPLSQFMLDTKALAKFENGFVAEAVRLQEKAIATGGVSKAYQDRLRMYRAALKARKEKTGTGGKKKGKGEGKD